MGITQSISRKTTPKSHPKVTHAQALMRHFIIPKEYENYKFTKDVNSMHKLSQVRPELIKKVFPIMACEEKLGWKVIVAEGMRTKAQEREKVRKGYSQTMHSKHLTGSAVDIVSQYGWDGPASNLKYKFWKDQGACAHKVGGVTWGGDWHSFKDVAHIQIDH